MDLGDDFMCHFVNIMFAPMLGGSHFFPKLIGSNYLCFYVRIRSVFDFFLI
jgi:hypothetical protein